MSRISDRAAWAVPDPAAPESTRGSLDAVVPGTTTVDRSDVRWGPDGLLPCIVQDSVDRSVLMLAWMDPEALAATLETGLVHFHSRSRGRLWRKGETSGNVLRLRWMALDCDADALLVGADPAGPTCHTGARSCFGEAALAVGGMPTAGARVTEAVPAGSTASGEPATDPGTDAEGFAWLETLWSTIVDRKARRPTGSYTARLLDGGVDAAGRKVLEEAGEVLMAAKDDAVAERAAAGPGAQAAGPGAPPTGPGAQAAATSGERLRTRAALAGEMADLLFHQLVLLAERGMEPGEVVEVLRDRHAG
jgi:phosphoribosyl-ATP pyrophosphohydrolase/phosphoribosyl-AMP cyclohydrolase